MIIYNAKMGNTLGGVEVQNGVITRVLTGCQSGDLNAGGNLLLPGLIDVHTHGCAGMDTMDADFAPMCRFWAAHGTTSFLPTTMTMDYGSLKRVTKAKTNFAGANILGFHFEGPYISKNHKGAQNEVFIKNPDYRAFCEFERVKMVTVAPELPGGEAFIKAASKNTVVSIGHTDCSYQTACSAIAVRSGSLLASERSIEKPPSGFCESIIVFIISSRVTFELSGTFQSQLSTAISAHIQPFSPCLSRGISSPREYTPSFSRSIPEISAGSAPKHIAVSTARCHSVALYRSSPPSWVYLSFILFSQQL